MVVRAHPGTSVFLFASVVGPACVTMSGTAIRVKEAGNSLHSGALGGLCCMLGITLKHLPEENTAA